MKNKRNTPRQLDLVYAAMSDGKWRTLWELADHINWRFGKRCAETAISARIRELGGAGVRYEKRERCRGVKLRNVWEYRIVPTEAQKQFPLDAERSVAP